MTPIQERSQLLFTNIYIEAYYTQTLLYILQQHGMSELKTYPKKFNDKALVLMWNDFWAV